MHECELNEWVTEVREPAHQIEKIMDDCLEMSCFQWLSDYIKDVNTVTEVLYIDKGLEQSIASSEELDQKFYKLRSK